MLGFTSVRTPVGVVYVAFSGHRVRFVALCARDEADFVGQLACRFGAEAAGAARDDAARSWLQPALDRWFRDGTGDVDLDLSGTTPFQREVMEAVRRIPRGETRSYAEIARQVGRPGAARAVGQVMAANPVPLFVPCHRVVHSDGRLGQYSGGGPAVKRRLLRLEGCRLARAAAHLSPR